MPEIIAHNPAEDEPSSTDRAFDRATDFRFANARVVADRNFHDAEAGECTFQDHLDCPTVGGFFKLESTKHIGTARSKRTEICNIHVIEKTNQRSRKMVAERLVPRHSATLVIPTEPATESDVRSPFEDRGEQGG